MPAQIPASTRASPTRMLTAALVATLVSALAVSSVGVWAVSDSLEESAEIARREERTAYLITSIGRDIARLRGTLLEAVAEGGSGPAPRLHTARAIESRAAEVRRALPPLLGPEEEEIWLDLRPRLDRMLERFDRTIAALERRRVREARALLDDSAHDSALLAAEIDRFQQVSLDDTEAAIEAVQARTAHTLEIVSLAKIGLLATVAFAWILVLRIVAAQRRALAVQIDRLETINRDLEAFAGRVAHDMRNVLAPIQLGTEAIAASHAEPKVREIATRLERSCARGRELVEGLLAFSRAAEPSESDGDRQANLSHELEDVLDQLEASIVDADVRVSTRVPPDAEIALPPPLLHAVLLNLVDNAVKFMRDEPERRLSIEAHTSPTRVTMRIADTGPGIPEQDRARIFDALYRGAAQRKEGMGLGLATVKRIVESRGGRIEIDTTGARGTTFVLRLPRAAADAETDDQTSTTQPDAPS